MKQLAFGGIVLLMGFLAVSCAQTDSRRSGGAAFDDSELGRKLDSGAHLPDPEIPGRQSFEQWRQD